MSDHTKPLAMVSLLAAVGSLAAGAALLLAAAAFAYQSGIIADATGGDGSATPVESAMWIAGLILLITGGVLVVVALQSTSARTDSAAGQS